MAARPHSAQRRGRDGLAARPGIGAGGTLHLHVLFLLLVVLGAAWDCPQGPGQPGSVFSVGSGTPRPVCQPPVSGSEMSVKVKCEYARSEPLPLRDEAHYQSALK